MKFGKNIIKKSKDITSNDNMDEHNIKLCIMKKLGAQKELEIEEIKENGNTAIKKENSPNKKIKKSKKLNKNLHKAKDEKNDEVYTQLSDIEKELKHYQKHFKNKIVYCNCDDPTVSNFFYYFFMNFKALGLKKLITTCYKNKERDEFSKNEADDAIYLEYSGTKNSTGIPNYDRDIIVKKLKGDKNFKGGDFRSKECIKLLEQADIVVTNPPFSLFREYVNQLIENDKKFLIIGNNNAITYKKIFKIIKENKIWMGVSPRSMTFLLPDKSIKTVNANWFTNLEHSKRNEKLILYKKYNIKDYPKYENYDAIDVSKTKNIPMDYKGTMGVPITFMSKYNPKQFEIIGLGISKSGLDIGVKPYKKEHEKYRKEIQKRGAVDGDLYMIKKGIVTVPYARILIKNNRDNDTYFFSDLNARSIPTWQEIINIIGVKSVKSVKCKKQTTEEKEHTNKISQPMSNALNEHLTHPSFDPNRKELTHFSHLTAFLRERDEKRYKKYYQEKEI
jgi:hypothetical protein